MWKNAILLLVTLALCLALLGGAFWWLGPTAQQSTDADLPGYADLVAYDPTRFGGHLRPSVNSLVRGARDGAPVRWITDGRGFRNRAPVADAAPPGTLRVLFYGDSFVDGMRTDQDDTIGARLESALGAELARPVEVIISGHNNPANAWYHWQTHGQLLAPEIVLIGLTVGNDLTSHNFGAGVRPVATSLEQLVSLQPGEPMAGIGSAEALIPPDGFLPEPDRSRLALYRSAVRETLARRFGALAALARPAMGPRPGVPGEAQAAGFFTSLGLFYRGELPFIRSLEVDFELLLRGFTAQIRHFGARPVLVAFPSRVEALDRDWERLADALQLDRERFDRERFARRLTALCEALALPCLLTTQALREGARSAPVFRPLGDMHLSEHGQATVARTIAPFLVALLATPAAAAPDDAWLLAYRQRLRDWARTVVRLRSPWIEETGVGRLALPGDHAALRQVLGRGWRSNGPGKAYWSAASQAAIHLPVPVPGRPVELALTVKPFLAAPNRFRQRIRVTVDGQPVSEHTLSASSDGASPEFQTLRLSLPPGLLSTPTTRIDLDFPDALVPIEHGLSGDRRRLGIAVVALRVVPAAVPPEA